MCIVQIITTYVMVVDPYMVPVALKTLVPTDLNIPTCTSCGTFPITRNFKPLIYEQQHICQFLTGFLSFHSPRFKMYQIMFKKIHIRQRQQIINKTAILRQRK